MKVRRRKRNLVIELSLLDEPRPSKSGKSVLIASSFGVRKSKQKVDGNSLLYVANVFYYPVARQESASGNAKKRSNRRAAASKFRPSSR